MDSDLLEISPSTDLSNPINLRRPKRRECPVCYSTLITPIYQCYRGHLICENCLPQLQFCPICRDNYPSRKIRAREFEDLIREFMTACPYKNQGCTSVLDVDEVQEHVLNCEYRFMTRCPTCCVQLSEKCLAGHLKSVHGLTGVETYKLGDVVDITQSCYLWDFNHSLIKWKPHFLICGHTKFFFNTSIHSNGKFVRWTVKMENDRNEVPRHKVTLKLNKLVTSNIQNKTSTIWTGYLSGSTTISDTDSFSIPLQQLESYSHFTNDKLGIIWQLSVNISPATDCDREEDSNQEGDHSPTTINRWPLKSTIIHDDTHKYVLAAFYPGSYSCPYSHLCELRNGVLLMSPIVMYTLFHYLRQMSHLIKIPKVMLPTSETKTTIISGSQQPEIQIGASTTPINIDEYILKGTLGTLLVISLFKIVRWIVK